MERIMDTFEPTPSTGGRNRLLWVSITGVIVIVLLVAGVMLIPRLLNTTASTVNVTASAMPADTQLYFSFNPHFSTLPNGDVILKAWDDPAIVQAFEDGMRDVLRSGDLTWEEDIASWLGDEVGIGVGRISISSFDRSGAPPPVITVAVSTRDKAKSDALLAKVRARYEENGPTFTEEPYRDVPTVVQDTSSRGPVLAYATVKDMVILASERDALHAAIDAALDGKGLDTTANYQSTLSKLRGGRAVTGYMDLGPFMKALFDQMRAQGANPLSVEMTAALEEIEALKGAAFGVSFEPNGILTEFVGTVDVDKLPAESAATLTQPSSDNSQLRAVPDSVFAYLGASLPADTFTQVFETPYYAQTLDMLKEQSGIDLKEDFLSWFNGDIAFVAMPGVLSGEPGQLPFGLAVMVEPADKQTAADKLDGLVKVIAEEMFYEVGQVIVSDMPMNALLDPRDQPVFLYGLIGDNLVMTLSENTVQKLVNAGGRSLADDATFKEVTAPLPQNNSGYLYVRPETIVDMVSLGMTFSGRECQACALFKPVRALALAGEQPPVQPSVGRSVMFILLDTGED
jgi:flagellar basal body-associated protein FliL